MLRIVFTKHVTNRFKVPREVKDKLTHENVKKAFALFHKIHEKIGDKLPETAILGWIFAEKNGKTFHITFQKLMGELKTHATLMKGKLGHGLLESGSLHEALDLLVRFLKEEL